MKQENLFYLLLILTILITRILILIIPEIDIKLSGIIIHHFWFGLLLIIAGFIIPKKKTFPKILLYGIGAGLLIDQLIFIILGAGKDKEYWTLPSLLGAFIITLAIYPIRTKLIKILFKDSKVKRCSKEI